MTYPTCIIHNEKLLQKFKKKNPKFQTENFI